MYFIATNVLLMQPTWQKVTFLSTLPIYLFRAPLRKVEQGQWRIYCNVFKCAVKGKYFHGPNIKIFNSYSEWGPGRRLVIEDRTVPVSDPARPLEVYIKDQFVRSQQLSRLYHRHLTQPIFLSCTVTQWKVKSIIQSMMFLSCTSVLKD